ncbi:MAG: hypothetical protein AB8G96_01345, partial [Phycisphaerales bacterium]
MTRSKNRISRPTPAHARPGQATPAIVASLAVASATLAGGPGEIFTIDTTTGAINGSAPDDVNGVLVTFDGTIGGDIARFIVHGNLLLNA